MHYIYSYMEKIYLMSKFKFKSKLQTNEWCELRKCCTRKTVALFQTLSLTWFNGKYLHTQVIALAHERNCGSNYRRFYCLFKSVFRLVTNKTSKLHVIGLFVSGVRSSQRASNAESVSMPLCRHEEPCYPDDCWGRCIFLLLTWWSMPAAATIYQH